MFNYKIYKRCFDTVPSEHGEIVLIRTSELYIVLFIWQLICVYSTRSDMQPQIQKQIKKSSSVQAPIPEKSYGVV